MNPTLLAADWAFPSVFLMDMDMHCQRDLAIVAHVEVRAANRSALDIDEML